MTLFGKQACRKGVAMWGRGGCSFKDTTEDIISLGQQI